MFMMFLHVLMISIIRATAITGTTHRLKAKSFFKYLTIQGILQKTRSYGKREEMRSDKGLKGVNGKCFRRNRFF